MVFIVDYTPFDRSWQFNFIFGIDRTSIISQFCFDFRVDQIYRISHVILLPHFRKKTKPNLIGHNNLISFLVYTTSIRSLTTLSYMDFIIVGTQSNQSQYFNIIFDVNHMCTIDHNIVLSGFHHRAHSI